MKCVATIGSFDGVHQGHRHLLCQVRHIADEHSLRAMAITFSKSPKRVLGFPDAPQLTSVEERTTQLYQMGMDEVAVLDFTHEMAAMSARDFMQKVLKEQLHVTVLIIGYDHRFGRGRSEGFDDYVRYGREMGIEVIRGEVNIDNGEPVSSTRIRTLLAEGRVEEATRLLGYHYTLQGNVVDGYKEGRKMGFPTANIRLRCPEKLVPADGVYAVWVSVGRQTTDHEQQTAQTFSIFNSQLKKGMLNIGYRPTLNNGVERSIEVHILDFDGELYGEHIAVELVHRLREEQAFSNLDELTEQLKKDKERVRELLGKHK